MTIFKVLDVIQVPLSSKKLNVLIAETIIFVSLVLQPTSKFLEIVAGIPRINITAIFFMLALLILSNILMFYREIEFDHLPIFTVFLAYLIVVQLAQYPWARDYGLEGSTTYLKTIAKTIIGYLLWFFVGFQLQEVFTSRRFRQILIGGWVFYVVIILNFAFKNIVSFAIELNGNLIYLMLADTFALLSVFVLMMIRRTIARYFVLFTSTITLFPLLSRTSLYVFILVIILYLYKNNKMVLLMGGTVSVLVLVALSGELQNERMFRLAMGGFDKSAQMRENFLREGLEGIRQHWMIGYFMADIIEYQGKTGGYIHNYLEFIRQFGIFPFIAFILAIGINYCKIAIEWLFETQGNYGELLFYLASFIIAEATLSRSHHFPYTMMVIASIHRYYYQLRKTGDLQLS